MRMVKFTCPKHNAKCCSKEIPIKPTQVPDEKGREMHLQPKGWIERETYTQSSVHKKFRGYRGGTGWDGTGMQIVFHDYLRGGGRDIFRRLKG